MCEFSFQLSFIHFNDVRCIVFSIFRKYLSVLMHIQFVTYSLCSEYTNVRPVFWKFVKWAGSLTRQECRKISLSWFVRWLGTDDLFLILNPFQDYDFLHFTTSHPTLNQSCSLVLKSCVCVCERERETKSLGTYQ